jgi:hypothetical protein
MDHVAIMKKSWGLIPKILSDKKTIESRWYQAKRAPWDKVRAGDAVYFKDSGGPIIARAKVAQVMQFEMGSLADARRICDAYGKEICLINDDPASWKALPKYCILMRLKDPRAVRKPFLINKEGFGSAAAWICVKSINSIRR